MFQKHSKKTFHWKLMCPVLSSVKFYARRLREGVNLFISLFTAMPWVGVCYSSHLFYSIVQRISLLTAQIIFILIINVPYASYSILKALFIFRLGLHLDFARLLNWRYIYYLEAQIYRIFFSTNYQAARKSGFKTRTACVGNLVWLDADTCELQSKLERNYSATMANAYYWNFTRMATEQQGDSRVAGWRQVGFVAERWLCGSRLPLWHQVGFVGAGWLCCRTFASWQQDGSWVAWW